MVIPEIGLELEPTSPTMRELTATKKKAKARAMKPAAIPPGARERGKRARRRKQITMPATRMAPGISRSVRERECTLLPRSPRVAARALLIIIGRDRTKVTTPPKATAPAPM
jgi:hypothetical protein